VGGKSDKLLEQLKSLTTNQIEDSATFDTQAIEALKFHECLPPPLQQSVLKARTVNRDLLNGILSTHTTPVYVSEEEPPLPSANPDPRS